MKKRFAEQQIAFALRQAESGTRVTEICRRIGVSEPTSYRCKKQFSGMGAAEIRRLKQSGEESRRLKQVVGDLTLDKQMLQDVLSRSSGAPGWGRVIRAVTRT